jgi:DNA-directed RNA polymerase specialized sigma24 family protein
VRPDDREMSRLQALAKRRAWQTLSVRYRDRVFGTALRFLADESAACDVTQDVFVSVFAHARSYRPTGDQRPAFEEIVAEQMRTGGAMQCGVGPAPGKP